MSNLIVSNTPVATSAFISTLAKLRPIRWYPLDDFGTGTARDLGSQKKPGSYADGSHFAVTPGLVPGSSSCVGNTAPNTAGISIPATGLPTGAAPWTFGGIAYIWFRNPAGANLALWNQMLIGWTNTAFVLGFPTSNIQIASSALFGLWLFAGTYDGITARLFIYSPVTNQNGGALLGSTSTNIALNLVSGSAALSTGYGNNYMQHIFFFDYALTQAQIAGLAENIHKVG